MSCGVCVCVCVCVFILHVWNTCVNILTWKYKVHFHSQSVCYELYLHVLNTVSALWIPCEEWILTDSPGMLPDSWRLEGGTWLLDQMTGWHLWKSHLWDDYRIQKHSYGCDWIIEEITDVSHVIFSLYIPSDWSTNRHHLDRVASSSLATSSSSPVTDHSACYLQLPTLWRNSLKSL